MNIPKSLKVALALKERTTKWLYTKMKKSEGWLYKVLNGDRELSMASLQEVCDLLEMKVSYFIALGE